MATKRKSDTYEESDVKKRRRLDTTLSAGTALILRLLSLGLCDEKSFIAKHTKNKLFDRNVLRLIRDFILDLFAFGSKGRDDGQFSNPVAAVLDTNNQRLYVLEAGSIGDYNTDGRRVQVFSADGKNLLFAFGAPGTGPLEFDYPYAMALHSLSSHLYIADRDNGRVQVVTLDGRFVREFGKGTPKWPSGVACDSSTGLVFVADCGHDAVFVFDANGALQFRFGSCGAGDGQLRSPKHLCIDSVAEELFVADSGNHRVCVFSTRNGEFRRRFGSWGSAKGQLTCPQGIALHPSRPEIIVADTNNSRLQVFDRRTGAFVRSIGSYGSYGRDVGQLCAPKGVCVDPASGAIYVCENHNDRVQCLRGLL